VDEYERVFIIETNPSLPLDLEAVCITISKQQLQTKCVTVGLGGRRKVDPTSHHCEKFGLNSTKKID
jgi:hypothetical protein